MKDVPAGQLALFPEEVHQPSVTEIETSRQTRAQLAAWGVPWPPPKGWRRKLLEEARERGLL